MLRRIYCKLAIVYMLCFPGMAVSSGFIDTPDTCLIAERIDEVSIHLKRSGVCAGKPGRAYIDSIAGGQSRKVFVDGSFWSDQRIQPLSINDVAEFLSKSDMAGKQMELRGNVHSEEMRKSAQATFDYYAGTEFQTRLAKETERIKQDVLGVPTKEYYKDNGVDKEELPGLGPDEHVVRQYIADAARINGRGVELILRGFIGGMQTIAPTVDFVARVLKASPACENSAAKKCEMHKADIRVDPMLFRKYGVTSVPSFVYAWGVKPLTPGMSEGVDGNLAEIGSHIKMSGDVKLQYALNKLSQEANSSALSRMASQF